MALQLTRLAVMAALSLGLAACGSADTAVGTASATTSAPSAPTASPSEPAPSPTESPSAPPSAEAMIAITDFAYEVPPTVAPGATITITNADSQAHTLTSKEGGFDVKVDGSGTATLTAPSTPGRYPFVCAFHGGMTGTLVVG